MCTYLRRNGYTLLTKKINMQKYFGSKFRSINKIMNMKKDFSVALAVCALFALCLLTGLEAFGQEEEASTVKWMTFEEAVEKSKTEKRKIFIDVYTDWCGWCKVMDKKTFSEPAVAKLLNEKYYPVKFNAEQRGDVTFRGTTFKFIPYGSKGTHQLAAALLQNQLSYPSVVFLNEDFAIMHIQKGYTQAPDFHKLADYYSTDYYKTKRTDEWELQYRSPF